MQLIFFPICYKLVSNRDAKGVQIKEISKEELTKNNVIRVNNWKEIGELLLKDY